MTDQADKLEVSVEKLRLIEEHLREHHILAGWMDDIVLAILTEHAALRADALHWKRVYLNERARAEQAEAELTALMCEAGEHRAELKLIANAIGDFYQGRGNVNTILDRIHSVVFVSAMEDKAREGKAISPQSDNPTLSGHKVISGDSK